VTPTASTPPTETPTPTDTTTATVTATLTETATATQTPIGCVGDCNGDGSVTVEEIVRGVGIALGSTPVSACRAMDRNQDAEVGIFELINAVSNALEGCRPPL
jgi:hypothetical protein